MGALYPLAPFLLLYYTNLRKDPGPNTDRMGILASMPVASMPDPFSYSFLGVEGV